MKPPELCTKVKLAAAFGLRGVIYFLPPAYHSLTRWPAMSDSLSFLPFALAAGGGELDGVQVRALVAAGVTLLRRSAPVVRAMDGKRSAIMLPPSSAFITSLAASSGRGAVVLDTLADPSAILAQVAECNVGIVFTTNALASRVPDHVGHVIVDDVPRAAQVVLAAETRVVDLGAHVGLALSGEVDADGSEEEAVVIVSDAAHGGRSPTSLSHAQLLSCARETARACSFRREDHTIVAVPGLGSLDLIASFVAPMLSGGSVTAVPRADPATLLDLLAREPVTGFVGVRDTFAALIGALPDRRSLGSASLRLCYCAGASPPPELQAAWTAHTGMPLLPRHSGARSLD